MTQLPRRPLVPSPSAVDNVKATLAAIDALAGTAWSNLIVARREASALIAEAEALDVESASGPGRGPLHGICVFVKDNIDVEGLPTRAGSDATPADPAVQDALITQKLRAAGAIVIGKSHMHELAYGPTGAVSANGPARHPHDADLITGGSSSGSAALVALGVVPVAIGSDTGCSVRLPAVLCGVSGYRPGPDELKLDGVVTLAPTFDRLGVIASTPGLTMAAWGALTGTPPAKLPSERRTKVGFLPPAGGSPEVAVAVHDAASSLAAAGHELVTLELPEADRLAELYREVLSHELARDHADLLGSRADRLQPLTRSRVATLPAYDPARHAAAVSQADSLAAEVCHRWREQGAETVLMRVAPITTPSLKETTAPDSPIPAILMTDCIPVSVLGLPTLAVPLPTCPGAGAQICSLDLTPPGRADLLALAELITTSTDHP